MSTHPFFVVVTPRPSDPTEIVSVMDSTDFDGRDLGDPPITTLAGFEEYLTTAGIGAGNTFTVAVTPEVLDEYIETPEAAARKHMWLTI